MVWSYHEFSWSIKWFTRMLQMRYFWNPFLCGLCESNFVSLFDNFKIHGHTKIKTRHKTEGWFLCGRRSSIAAPLRHREPLFLFSGPSLNISQRSSLLGSLRVQRNHNKCAAPLCPTSFYPIFSLYPRLCILTHALSLESLSLPSPSPRGNGFERWMWCNPNRLLFSVIEAFDRETDSIECYIPSHLRIRLVWPLYSRGRQTVHPGG